MHAHVAVDTAVNWRGCYPGLFLPRLFSSICKEILVFLLNLLCDALRHLV